MSVSPTDAEKVLFWLAKFCDTPEEYTQVRAEWQDVCDHPDFDLLSTFARMMVALHRVETANNTNKEED